VVTGSAEVEPGRVSVLRVAEEAFLAFLVAVIIRLFPCVSHADCSTESIERADQKQQWHAGHMQLVASP